MQQMTLNLDRTMQRPVIVLKDGISALLDTGAFFPVWVGSREILTKRFHGEFIKKNVPFVGFGGKTVGDLFKVTLNIGNLIFPNMSILVNDELVCPFHLILSASMFKGLIYEVDDRNHKLNVTVPDGESNIRNLVITDRDGRLHIFCNSVE